MNLLTMAANLLGQIDRPEELEALGRGFHDECSQTHFIAVLVAVAALGVVYVLARLYRRSPDEGVIRVSHLAEGAHRLGLRQEELDDLRTVAGRASLPHPAAMLLSPANLARAARAAQAGRADPVLQERLDRLALRLFGRHLAECEPEPPKGV